MMFPIRHLRAIRDGAITTAYRRWDRPRVKAGGTQRTAVGVVAFDAVTEVPLESISEADAQAAGHSAVEEMLDMFGRRSPDWPIWRIDLHFAGPDPRVALREDSDLSDEDVAALRGKLNRLDAASTHGPWTRTTLELIRDRPEVRAPDLAASPGSRDEVAQARRAQAQGAGADGVAADWLPHLAARERAAGAAGEKQRRLIEPAGKCAATGVFDGEGRNRTGDTTIFSRVLYQLSYLAAARRW